MENPKQNILCLILMVFVCLSPFYLQSKALPGENYLDSLLDVAYELEFSEPDSAIAIYNYIGKVAEKLEDWKLKGQTYSYRAIVFFELGEIENALSFNIMALELYERAAYYIGVASVKINIGNIRLISGAYDAAIKHYYEGLEIMEEFQDTLRLSISYMNIGTLFYRNKYYDEALNYNFRALYWARKLQISSIISDLHTNTANVYFLLGNSTAYLQYIDSAITYSTSAQYLFGLMNAYNSLATYNREKQDYESALQYSLLAVESARLYGNPANIAEVYTSIGLSFLMKNMTDSARVYLENAIEISSANNYLDLLATSKLNLSRVYQKTGDYPKAFSELSEYVVLNDSLFRMEKQREIQEMDRRYRIVQKENEIEQQKLTIELREKEIRKKDIMVTSFIALAITALAFFLVIWQWMKNRNQLSVRELEKIKLEREKYIMNAVIQGEEKERYRIARELHDGVNGNLAALKLQLSQYENNQFDQLLDRTMDEVRTLSHNLVPDVVRKFGLNEALLQFTTSIRTGTKLELDYQFHGEIPAMDGDVEVHVYRIVQELVSNVIKHAEAKNLMVQLVASNNNLSITVEDDGKGFEIIPENGLSFQSNGIGLAGIENRITWLKGNFDIHSSTQSGTSIHIDIPIYQKIAL